MANPNRSSAVLACTAALIALLGAMLSGCTVARDIGGAFSPGTASSAPQAIAPAPSRETLIEPAAAPSPAARPGDMMGRPALVIVRFADEPVAYERALFDALSAALAAKPDARFAIVGIAPPQAEPAALTEAQADAGARAADVMQVMAEMGLPAERLMLLSTTSPIASATEVRVFAY